MGTSVSPCMEPLLMHVFPPLVFSRPGRRRRASWIGFSRELSRTTKRPAPATRWGRALLRSRPHLHLHSCRVIPETTNLPLGPRSRFLDGAAGGTRSLVASSHAVPMPSLKHPPAVIPSEHLAQLEASKTAVKALLYHPPDCPHRVPGSLKLSVGGTCPSYLLEIDGLLTQGS